MPDAVTIGEARAVFDAYVLEHPLPMRGAFHLDGWYEDGDDYLPVWGAREFLVDGHDEFARWDDLAIFIDKASGAVREEQFLPNRLKIRAMSPVERADRPID